MRLPVTSGKIAIALALGALLLALSILLPAPGSSSRNFGAAIVSSPFVYSWNSNGVLAEAPTMLLSTSPYWWVNSGGRLIIENGEGKTIQGNLPTLDYWRVLYSISNPTDTDGGYHPQNLFRLVSKSKWENVRLQTSFTIQKDNFSASPNRNASNGLLLMSRYAADGQTLYYAGVRVDGTAVLKKKYKGTYSTMAQKVVFPGTYAIALGTSTSQNLLPHGERIGLRSETSTKSDGTVVVSLYMQREGETAWKLLLTATDDGKKYGSPVITGSGYTGLRTDFMDVKFTAFRAETI